MFIDRLYLVTNTIAAFGGCSQVTESSPITITTLPVASIEYVGAPFYISDLPQSVILTGTVGGSYSVSPAGLTIDASSGEITGATIWGNYTITYTIEAAGCGIVTATTNVIVLNGIVTVSGSTLADGNYASLTNANGAFAAINSNDQTGNSIIVTISKSSTAESGTNSLNAKNWADLTLYPTVSGITISGNVNKPLIDLNGSDNVTIDGRVNEAGEEKDLIITNTSTGTGTTNCTIRLINSAENNTFKYCTIKGSSLRSSSGIILFSTSTAGNGNDGNTIDHCDITSDVAGRPLNAIYSVGIATRENSGNTISNNNIYDFLNHGTASNGINLAAHNISWSITGNSLYETTLFEPAASVAYSVINASVTTSVDITISGNYIGGSSALAGGTAWKKTNAFNNVFTAIRMNVGLSPASNVHNNVIQNFDWSNSLSGGWTGIHIQGGDVNVGTISGNTIGAATGTGSITVTGGSSTTSVYGINIASIGTVDCQNNNIGSIVAGNTSTLATNLYGINKTAVTGITNISNNFIGSLTTANSLHASSMSTTSAQSVFGILSAGTGTITITGNLVANMTNGTTNATTGTRGRISGIAVVNGTDTISNNTIRNLTIANANNNSTTSLCVSGIALTGATLKHVSGNSIYNLSNTFDAFTGSVVGLYFNGGAETNSVLNNTIYNLSVEGASAGAAIVTGLYFTADTVPNIVNGNFIHSLSAVYSNTAFLYGIRIGAGATSYTNNIISIGGNSSATIYGMYETGGVDNNNNVYFNTIYIGGTPTGGALQSYALYSNKTANLSDFRNNILYNARSNDGATGTHYAIRISGTANLTIDNNDYYAPGSGGVLGSLSSDRINLSAWQTGTGQDANSQSSDPVFTAAGSTDATGYKIGIDLVGDHTIGLTSDYGGSTRNNPTMGAWELPINKWIGTTSIDWNTISNWTGNRIPAMNANILFDDAPVNHCLLDQDRVVNNIVNAQTTYRMVTNGNKLTVKGDFIFSNNAQIDASANNSTIEFAGIVPQTIPSGAFLNDEVYNLAVNNINNVKLQGTVRLLNALTTTSGRLDASNNLSTVSYSGILAQTIGSQFLGDHMYNLEIDNAEGVSMAIDLTLDGNLNLAKGLLSLDANTLTFQNSDTPISRTSGHLLTTEYTNLHFGTEGNMGGAAFTIPDGTFATDAFLNNLTINRTNSLTLNNQMILLKGILLCNTGILNTNGNLTLLSTSDQTALIDGTGTGDVLGDVTMERYLPSAFGYKYFSSPFQAATVAEFAQEVDLEASFPSFYKYDENNSIDSLGITVYRSGWVKYINPDNTLDPLAGYAANLGADVAALAITANITGVVNNWNLQTSFQNNNRKYTKGFNLMGNPYPSPIDWDATTGWTKTNIDNALYFFNASGTQYSGTYSSYVNGETTGNGSNVIAAMQGFFVHVSDGTYPVSGTLGVTNSARINNLTPVFKRAFIDNRTTLRFTASFEHKNAIEDAAVIYFENDASLRFEKELDALKMTNTDVLVPNIYTLTPESIQLSINGMPLPIESVSKVPLGISTFTDGWLTLSADDISRLPAYLHIYLLDAETGLQRNLKQLPDYRFYLKSGQFNGRFSLVFSSEELSELVGIPGKLFTLYRSGNYVQLKANLPLNTRGSLIVTNILGQVILRREVYRNETVEINQNVSTGVYVITLYSGKMTHSEKVIMKNE